MILASAQTNPNQNVTKNLDEHYQLTKLASDNGADLIVFPEMSITGYERSNADKISFSENDSRLDRLRSLSVDSNMIIIVGAPIRIDSDLFIGSFVLYPDTSISIYTKQFLHSGEELFYKSSFDYNPTFNLKGERISLAICADINNPLHAENAYKSDTTTYISSIFFTMQGMPEANGLLSGYARKYSMNVLMSNYYGQVWGLESGGRSAFWDKQGKLIAEQNDSDSGLLIVEKNEDIWIGKTIETK